MNINIKQTQSHKTNTLNIFIFINVIMSSIDEKMEKNSFHSVLIVLYKNNITLNFIFNNEQNIKFS